MVAMLILSFALAGMVAVSVAGFRSYQKSKAIKTVSEDVGFALNSVAKDVRMGKIEYKNIDSNCIGEGAGKIKKCLIVSRNVSGKKICYKVTDAKFTLYENDGVCSGSASQTKDLVDLTNTTMRFDGNSGFYDMATSDSTVSSPNKIRGWAEINFDIISPGMETDSIRVQTTVSSRDYGWEAVP